MDRLRRLMGERLDTAGLGPLETPFDCVYGEPGMSLRRYNSQYRSSGPVVLIVPAPIKAAYIWDAMPSLSVVQRCLKGDCRVYLVEWTRPDSGGPDLGLDDYTNRLLVKCLNAIQAETGNQSVFLAGHSLGGTFAAICAALHPQQVAGLLLLSTPLHFSPHVGPLDRLVAASSHAHVLTALMKTVPGSLLTLLSSSSAPESFSQFRWMDWLNSVPDPEALRSHLLVVRWTLDETPLTKRLIEEVVETLYRRNCFMSGNLKIDGRKATPDQVVAPLSSVVDRKCNVVPPDAVLPFHHAARSTDKQLLWYEGDIGIALRHVGALVGRNAHQTLWPQIIQWMQTHHRTAP